MITRIKKVEWWNPKLKADALAWKVWVERNGETALHYFDSQEDLDKFSKTFETKTKKAKTGDKPAV
jgi:glycyl-tRNA synthetase alpha subunit